MALLAQRQLDHAFRREIAAIQRHLLVGDRGIVDAQATALDLAARLAIRCDQARFDEQPEHAGAGFEFGVRNLDRRQAFGDGAFLKGLPRGFGRGIGRVAAVQQRGCFRRQHLLGFVDLGALQRRELGDLADRQDREQFQEF